MKQAQQLKARALAHIDSIRADILRVSHEIWSNPELGLREERAAALLCDAIETAGHQVERGIAGLPTAFRSESGGPGAVVCLMAEYDALPGVGHGCGHNVIAANALGAYLGLASLGARLPGKVRLLGTPAEESAVEGAGGKIPILKDGHLKDAAACIMTHPATRNMAATQPSLAARALKLEFHGKAAHAASAPHLGVNALDAVLTTFNAVNALRQQVPPDVRIHGVITHGGESPNIIPAYAAARFRVRARDAGYLGGLYKRVLACAQGAAIATGCRLESSEDVHPYHNTVPNLAISKLLNANIRALGLKVDEPEATGAASTDFGNVTHAVPASFAYLAIAPRGTPGHSEAMCAAANSPAADEACINGAKLLALTTIDLLTDGHTLDEARKEFEKAKRLSG